MSDEFVKGLGVLMAGGLIWMVLSGWYATPSFNGAQLIGAVPEDPTGYTGLGLLVREGVFWFTVLGTMAFWIGVPAVERARESLAN